MAKNFEPFFPQFNDFELAEKSFNESAAAVVAPLAIDWKDALGDAFTFFFRFLAQITQAAVVAGNQHKIPAFHCIFLLLLLHIS